MLLQTIVQLNILLLAAPALAGWPGWMPCHYAIATARPAALEASEKVAVQPQAVASSVVAPHLVAATYLPSSPQATPRPNARQTVSFTLFLPFPLAVRAP